MILDVFQIAYTGLKRFLFECLIIKYLTALYVVQICHRDDFWRFLNDFHL